MHYVFFSLGTSISEAKGLIRISADILCLSRYQTFNNFGTYRWDSSKILLLLSSTPVESEQFYEDDSSAVIRQSCKSCLSTQPQSWNWRTNVHFCIMHTDTSLSDMNWLRRNCCKVFTSCTSSTWCLFLMMYKNYHHVKYIRLFSIMCLMNPCCLFPE